MDFKTTSTKSTITARRAGFALAELLVAVGITSLLILVVCAFSEFSGRSVIALYNYVDLDDANRIAMDQLTRDVRQSRRVKDWSTSVLVLEDADGLDLSYIYSPSTRTLTRTQGSVPKVVLQQCDRLSFWIGQRNTVGGSYDVYPVATPGTAKVVNVSWACSRSIFGNKQNTESVQTARIVIRKQGT